MTETRSSGLTPVRQDAAAAELRPAAPPRESAAPATPRPDGAEALDRIHKRAHELAPSKPAEAEPLFRGALEGYRKAEGPDGALTLDLTIELANLLYQSGRGADAEPLFRTALGPVRQRFGPADPRTAGILAPLGLSLIQQGPEVAKLSPSAIWSRLGQLSRKRCSVTKGKRGEAPDFAGLGTRHFPEDD